MAKLTLRKINALESAIGWRETVKKCISLKSESNYIKI